MRAHHSQVEHSGVLEINSGEVQKEENQCWVRMYSLPSCRVGTRTTTSQELTLMRHWGYKGSKDEVTAAEMTYASLPFG